MDDDDDGHQETSRTNVMTAQVGVYKLEWYFSDDSIAYATFLLCLYVDDLCQMGNQVDKQRDRSAFPEEWKQRMVRMSYNRSGQNILLRRQCPCHKKFVKIVSAKTSNVSSSYIELRKHLDQALMICYGFPN